MIKGKYIGAGLKVVVGVAVLYLLLSHVDGRALGSLLLQVKPVGFAAAAACLLIAVFLNALRWRAVLDLLGSAITWATALVGTFEGVFFNLFLPTSVGGDAVRAYRAFDRGVAAGVAIESALIDRAIGLWGLGLSLIVAAPFALAVPRNNTLSGVVLVSAVIVVAGAVVAIVGRLWVDPARFRSWLHPLAAVVAGYGRAAISLRFVTTIIPAVVLNTLLSCAAMWLIIESLGFSLSFADAAIVLQATTLAALVPVSFGGWGLREGATVFLLSSTGMPMSGALAAAVLFGVALTIAGLVGAILWLTAPYRGTVRFSEMRRGRAPAVVPQSVPDKGEGK